MNQKKRTPALGRQLIVGAALGLAVCGSANAQTVFGASTTLVFPVVASTGTFTGHITLYNPGQVDVTANLDYFDANNVPTPGAHTCADVIVPANTSIEFALAERCTLEDGSHFGILTVSDAAATNALLGYSRTENNAAQGFSIEAFPATNFTSAVSHVIGLRSGTAGPGFQTNCFAASLEGPVTYDLKLYDGTSGAQLGNTISGSLNTFEETRHLDVFASAGVPAGEYSNVRAEFTRTSLASTKLVGFCTMQDNASLGADFRIAKDATIPVVEPPVVQPPLTSQWQGTLNSIGSNQNAYVFLGPVASNVVLVSQATITSSGSGVFAINSGSKSISVGVCYQDQAGPGPVVLMGTATAATATTTANTIFASGSATVPPGTYNVGLCATNPGLGPVNRNGNTIGVVAVAS